MRRPSALLAGPLALSLIAGSASSQEPPRARQVTPTEHPERIGTTSPADQLGDPSCGGARNAEDAYYALPLTPDQSRAPRRNGVQKFAVDVLTNKLSHPFAFVFLPDGRMLVSLRSGGLRLVDKTGAVSDPIAGAPPITLVQSPGGPPAGMSDLVLDEAFAKTRTFYFAYATQTPDHKDGVGRIVRAKLSADGKSLTDQTVIHEAAGFLPRRMVLARDNTLLITGGEIASDGPTMQSLQSERGKVLRINTDGSAPKDNPYLKTPGADPALYAIGFRDQEGAALDPRTGELWTAESEPQGGDELNLVKPGHNYGFPVISYGRANDGSLLNHGLTAKEGLEQPVYFWTPSIAPSGLMIYSGKALPAWTGNIFLGSLSGLQLVRLEIKNGRVVAEEKLLRDRCQRIRDVRQGPDGLIYVITDADDGQVLRLAPAK